MEDSNIYVIDKESFKQVFIIVFIYRFFFCSREKDTFKKLLKDLFFVGKLRSDLSKPRDGFKNHEGTKPGPLRMEPGAEA